MKKYKKWDINSHSPNGISIIKPLNTTKYIDASQLDEAVDRIVVDYGDYKAVFLLSVIICRKEVDG